MKIALVTGANSGFGLMTCIEFVQAGFHVIATMRNLQNKDELVRQLKRLGRLDRVSFFQMDVTNPIEIAQVKEKVVEQFGYIHVLVNNAGYCQGGFIDDLTLEQWEKQQKTNVFGTFTVTKTFVPLLERTGQSHIINVSSVSGLIGFPGMSAYCSSKFAMEGFSESLRLELLPKNIYVSLVEPASYKTNIWEKSLKNVTVQPSDPPLKKQIYQYAKSSAENSGDPREVAKLIVNISQLKKPKFRYPIGKGARMLAVLKGIIPWEIIEKVIMRKLKSE